MVDDFDYSAVMRTVCRDLTMKRRYESASNNYEKLHVSRIMFDDRPTEGIQSSSISKFINQSFHIENDYIYQLNPAMYQTVPQYVIDECDRLVSNLSMDTTEQNSPHPNSNSEPTAQNAEPVAQNAEPVAYNADPTAEDCQTPIPLKLPGQ